MAHERIMRLDHRLRAEASGILTWLLAGCLAWQRDGLAPPASIVAATDDYRQEMDLLALFIAECCVLGDRCKAAAGDLYAAYETWAGQNRLRPRTAPGFRTDLIERGFDPPVKATGGPFKDRNVWSGIGLRQEVPDPVVQRRAERAEAHAQPSSETASRRENADMAPPAPLSAGVPAAQANGDTTRAVAGPIGDGAVVDWRSVTGKATATFPASGAPGGYEPALLRCDACGISGDKHLLYAGGDDRYRCQRHAMTAPGGLSAPVPGTGLRVG
jgi:hypothetical protein